MAQLVTTDLNKQPNAVTNAHPSTALRVIAFKGQKATDEVYLTGSSPLGGPPAGPVSGTSTDASPTLAGINIYAQTMLYLAWKVAGQNTVEVRQLLLGQDGFPVGTGKWESLPTTNGRPSNPAVSTDAGPAMAVGADNLL